MEVRGPTHIELSKALGDPGLLRIDSNDLTVQCRVQYRIFDSGHIQATIIYADPVLNHPNFDTVRRMIDAALQQRFPDTPIEIAEMYDYGDHTDMVDRELPPRDDSDFQARQESYRAEDRTTRKVDTRYAEPLGDIVDNAADQAGVDQLAKDLSGVYGPYRVEMWRATVERWTGAVIIGGHILNGDEVIGFVQFAFDRDAAGKLVAHHNAVEIRDERFKFKGFSKALASQLQPYYERSAVDRIELSTEQNGGYAWARQGFAWNPNPDKLQASLDSIKNSARRLFNWVSGDAQVVLREVVQRLEPAHPRLPEPRELADLATPDEPFLGRQLMHDTKWEGVTYLRGAAADGPNTLSSNEFRIVPVSREDATALSAYNCAHLVTDELSEMYDRDFHVDAAATPTGVPARALFEAIGSSAQFATYDEVADRLRELGDGLLGRSRIAVGRRAPGRSCLPGGERRRRYQPRRTSHRAACGLAAVLGPGRRGPHGSRLPRCRR